MERALLLANRASGLAETAAGCAEVPVGALVVTADGEIVGEAANAPIALHDPTAHAEVLAVRAAGQRLGNYRLSGCVLVVTLEPCMMCVGAIVHARLAGLVYGAADTRAGAVSSGLHGFDLVLHGHRPWHMGGVCAQACAALLHSFFAARR